MTPKSMTGFGRAQMSGERFAAEVEIRSLNNRYLKVRVHAPASISAIEPEIEDFIRKKLARGAVDVWVTMSDVAPAQAYRLDLEVVRRYREFAASLKDKEGIGGKIEISQMLALPGVVSFEGQDQAASDGLRPVVMELAEKAFAAMEDMRAREGQALSEDVKKRADSLGASAKKIAALVPGVVESYRDKLLARVNELLSGSNVEIAREDIIKEVSIFAERSDISEELARIDSHLSQLYDVLAGDGEVGRKLEFVAQELHREVNTIGSKANDAAISRLVVDAKAEVDRIREQTANLE